MTLLAVLPRLILSPWAGQAFLLHSHHEESVHAHALDCHAGDDSNDAGFVAEPHEHHSYDAGAGPSVVEEFDARSVGQSHPNGLILTLPDETPFHVSTATHFDRSAGLLPDVLSTAAMPPALAGQISIGDAMTLSAIFSEPAHSPCAPILRANHAILI